MTDLLAQLDAARDEIARLTDRVTLAEEAERVQRALGEERDAALAEVARLRDESVTYLREVAAAREGSRAEAALRVELRRVARAAEAERDAAREAGRREGWEEGVRASASAYDSGEPWPIESLLGACPVKP